MSLASRLAGAPGPRQCRLGVVLSAINNPDRDALEDALGNPGVSTARIVRALKAENIPVGKSTVQDHRNGSCCCDDADVTV